MGNHCLDPAVAPDSCRAGVSADDRGLRRGDARARPVRETPWSAPEDPPFNTVVVHETGHSKFQQEIISGRHHLIADEPQDAGGLDSGLARMIFFWRRLARAPR